MTFLLQPVISKPFKCEPCKGSVWHRWSVSISSQPVMSQSGRHSSPQHDTITAFIYPSWHNYTVRSSKWTLLHSSFISHGAITSWETCFHLLNTGVESESLRGGSDTLRVNVHRIDRFFYGKIAAFALMKPSNPDWINSGTQQLFTQAQKMQNDWPPVILGVVFYRSVLLTPLY